MTRVLPVPTISVRGIPIKATIPFHQIGVFRSVRFWESREPETMDWIDAFEHNCVFIDIGASFGNETLYAALKQNGPREIVCFDLDLHTSFNLAFNLKLNSITNVRQYYLALADRSGFVDKSEYTGYIGVPGRLELEKISYRTWGISLDEFVERAGTQPDYIKIDVDGFEDRVVRGMRETLRSPNLKSLLIEVNPTTRAPVIEMPVDAGFGMSSEVDSGADTVNIVFERSKKPSL